ncbi:MAG: ribonuclease H-like domain-containing protein [Kofleriaceae bacterium]
MARAFALPEYLILDIETAPDLTRWTRPEPVAGEEPRFPPTWAHRIVTIGYLRLDHGYRFQELGVLDPAAAAGGDDDDRERALLQELSLLVGERRPMLVTYNGRSFDLPVIALRALCHGVGMGWYYDDKDTRYRYSEHGHLDLCDWLADHGAVRAGKLDAITRLVGLPGKSGMDGSQVEGLYAAGKLAEIQRYCLADVAQTTLLFLRFRLLQGKLDPESCRERLTELLAALGRDGRVPEVLDGLDRQHLLGV